MEKLKQQIEISLSNKILNVFQYIKSIIKRPLSFRKNATDQQMTQTLNKLSKNKCSYFSNI